MARKSAALLKAEKKIKALSEKLQASYDERKIEIAAWERTVRQYEENAEKAKFHTTDLERRIELERELKRKLNERLLAQSNEIKFLEDEINNLRNDLYKENAAGTDACNTILFLAHSLRVASEEG